MPKHETTVNQIPSKISAISVSAYLDLSEHNFRTLKNSIHT